MCIRDRELVDRIADDFGLAAQVVATVAEAASHADIICTLTGAVAPILLSEHVSDGTHVNAVGSSRAGPSEIDVALVARARFIPDHREGVLAQGAEYLHARDAGLVTEAHVLPEIGHIFSGSAPGRIETSDVTIYKSLGSIVQDLASVAYTHLDVYKRQGMGRQDDPAARPD